MPLAEILVPLKLSALLEDALIRYQGTIGEFLSAVEASERLEESPVRECLAHNDLAADHWNRLTFEAHLWMLGAIHDQQDKDNGWNSATNNDYASVLTSAPRL